MASVLNRTAWLNNQAAGLNYTERANESIAEVLATVTTTQAAVATAADDTVDSDFFIVGPWPVCVAWLSFIFVVAGTARNAYRHLLNYSRPDLQPHVLRIILVGPIYTFSAALCLSMMPKGCFFIRAVRDIWEAVVIYSFLTLIVQYMGGEHLCLHSISQRDEAVPHLFPLNLCLPPVQMASMIRVPKIGALQFVVIKPVLALVSIVFYARGELEEVYYQWTLFFVYNVSYSVALYALYLVYWASHDHQALQAKRPLLKFISVKMIVFLTFWQALLLPHMPLPGGSARWEDFILAVEMVLFAVLMNIAFSWREFQSGLRGSDRSRAPVGVSKGKDLIDLEATSQPTPDDKTAGEVIGRAQRQEVAKNAKAAFCPRDIINDASTSFSWRYQQHVLIESAQEYELRDEPQPVPDLLGDTLGDGQHNSQVSTSQVSTTKKKGPLRTFKARTYLIGSSLGLKGRGQQDQDTGQAQTSPKGVTMDIVQGTDAGTCAGSTDTHAGANDSSSSRAVPANADSLTSASVADVRLTAVSDASAPSAPDPSTGDTKIAGGDDSKLTEARKLGTDVQKAAMPQELACRGEAVPQAIAPRSGALLAGTAAQPKKRQPEAAATTLMSTDSAASPFS